MTKKDTIREDMSFRFGDIVVVDDDQIGVIVKSWNDGMHDVYVRNYNGIHQYGSSRIKHYVYYKELTEEEKEFYS